MTTDGSKRLTPGELARKVVEEITRKAMVGPRFPVSGWPGHATIYVEAITAAITADRAVAEAAAYRKAGELFEAGHWARHELNRMATTLDGIASDGYPVGAALRKEGGR